MLSIKKKTNPSDTSFLKGRGNLLAWSILGLLPLTGLGYWGWTSTHPHQPEAENSKPTVHRTFKATGADMSHADEIPSDSVEVAVGLPKQGGIPRRLVQTGSLAPAESAKIHSKVSGYVMGVNADIGTLVEAGSVIVEIKVPELEQELLRAEASLAKVQSEVRRAAAQLKVAEAEKVTAEAVLQESQADIARFVAQRKLREKEFARLKSLADRGSIELKLLDERQALLEQAVSAEQHARKSVEVAQARISAIDANIELARSEVRSAESAVHIAEVEVQQAQTMVEFGKVTSPFTGVVTSRNCDLGDFVRAAAQGSSQPLFTIAQTDRMRVVISVPDRMVPFIRPGDSAEVRVDSLYGEVFTGRVARVSMRQDRQTRSMRAEIDLPNPQGRFIEGMYGSVTIVSRPPVNTVTVPAKALVGEIMNGIGRLRVVEDGRIKDVLAHIGLLQEGRVELVNWKETESPIVLEGNLGLTEGGLVENMIFADSITELAGGR